MALDTTARTRGDARRRAEVCGVRPMDDVVVPWGSMDRFLPAHKRLTDSRAHKNFHSSFLYTQLTIAQNTHGDVRYDARA